MNNSNKNPIKDYLQRVDSHLDRLHQENKISSPTREKFFEEFLGCYKTTWKNWYRQGIKRVYYVIIDLLDENKPY